MTETENKLVEQFTKEQIFPSAYGPFFQIIRFFFGKKYTIIRDTNELSSTNRQLRRTGKEYQVTLTLSQNKNSIKNGSIVDPFKSATLFTDPNAIEGPAGANFFAIASQEDPVVGFYIVDLDQDQAYMSYKDKKIPEGVRNFYPIDQVSGKKPSHLLEFHGSNGSFYVHAVTKNGLWSNEGKVTLGAKLVQKN